MSGGKEIRNKIKSVKNTQKITSAMQMVAASKMRKTQEKMQSMRHYSRQIIRLVNNITNASTDQSHPYIKEREVKRVGIVVINSDRGLCGGLNNNLLKQVSQSMLNWQKQNIDVDVVSIGDKSINFFKHYGGNVLATANHLGDAPRIEQLIGVIKVILDAYDSGSIDKLYIFTNLFVNTMVQKPSQVQLLPLNNKELSQLIKEDPIHGLPSYNWDYIYEPDSQYLLNIILRRYVETLIYQAVVENIACEMAARMVAMKAATDNAGDIISELQLVYNKARQSAITQELTEIVAGASAV